MTCVKNKYVEMTVSEFASECPEIWDMLGLHTKLELLSQKEYLVRVDPITFRVEFGFRGDDWFIR